MSNGAEIGPPRPIREIAVEASIPEGLLYEYGPYAAKVDPSALDALASRPAGSLVLVTAMSPTPAGEGKTTLTIGLTQSLKLLGRRAAACIRQPSLGPLLGSKGGATGSGLSRAVPADEISLGFTGDDYAISAAHNLVSSMIDNHVHHGNPLGLERVTWKRVSPINDRALRRVAVNAGSAEERVEEFHISAASELMAIICLSTSLRDLRVRVARSIVGYASGGRPVTIRDLRVDGAVAALLKKALWPNLAQTCEGAPVFIHGGPFGNISIGCSSLMATSIALKLSEVVLTEAGFSTELGAEKFFDIVCRAGGLSPSLAVIVATMNALRLHGGASDYRAGGLPAALKGLDNLSKHIENVRAFGVEPVVVMNRYANDTDAEITGALSAIRALGAKAEAADVRERGGQGGLDAARLILDSMGGGPFKHLYPLEDSVEAKLSAIATRMYGADGVVFSDEARKDIIDMERLGLASLPLCVAKTPKSLSGDPELLGRPRGFSLRIRAVAPAAGAGYLVAYTEKVLLMPGFPERPLAEGIDMDEGGRIRGI